MPSIRVRGRVYSTLEDSLEGEQSITLNEIETSRHLRHQHSMPVLSNDGSEATPATDEQPLTLRRRPRASTVSSRIHTHITRNSRTIPSFEPPVNPDLAEASLIGSSLVESPPPHETRTVKGSHAALRVPSQGDGGFVERSIEDESRLDPDHHHDNVVEHLDVIDPQIGTVSKLTNAANSILIPPSSWYSRKPVIALPSTPKCQSEGGEPFEDLLDRHVDDVLKRPSKIRRTLLGVWSFLKTPMGILTAIYGFLVVFWGAAIIFFLAKIINLHDDIKQGFWVEVSSQVETGLFTVTSIGLIPSRVLDTYRIFKIWRYKRRTMKLRSQAGLPQLFDVDDLPDPVYDPNYVHVLTEDEQEDLHRQQRKFQYSQTWYRAHGTETHRAFPISIALWICFLNDGNSIFQCLLCGTMWGLNRFERPAWSTGILIPAGFLCGIGAAVLIWRGGERTKRVEEVRERLRAALSEKNHRQGGRTAEELTVASPTLLHPNFQRKTDELSIVIDEQMVVPASNGTS